MTLQQEDKNALVTQILFKQLFNLRQSGDYDDWFDIDEKDIKPLAVPAEKFIAEIEKLIKEHP